MNITLSNLQPLLFDGKYETFTSKMACKNVEDNIKLIELIKNRPIIYDSNYLGYKDTVQKEAAWLDIAISMNWPIEVCQTRWKSLRDSFRKRDKKSSPDPNSVSQSTWRYTEMLSFLKNTSTRRKQANDAPISLCTSKYGASNGLHDQGDDSDHSDHALSMHVIGAEENDPYDASFRVKLEPHIEERVSDNFEEAPLPVNTEDNEVLAINENFEQDSSSEPNAEEVGQASTPVQRLSPKSAHKVLEALATANVLKRRTRQHRLNGFPYSRLPSAVCASVPSTIACRSPTERSETDNNNNNKRPRTATELTQRLPSPSIAATSLANAIANDANSNIATAIDEQTRRSSSPAAGSLENDKRVAGASGGGGDANDAAVAAAFFRRYYDEDDLFGLSIAAALKRCTDDQRLAAKIEIMRLLHVAQKD